MSLARIEQIASLDHISMSFLFPFVCSPLRDCERVRLRWLCFSSVLLVLLPEGGDSLPLTESGRRGRSSVRVSSAMLGKIALHVCSADLLNCKWRSGTVPNSFTDQLCISLEHWSTEKETCNAMTMKRDTIGWNWKGDQDLERTLADIGGHVYGEGCSFFFTMIRHELDSQLLFVNEEDGFLCIHRTVKL